MVLEFNIGVIKFVPVPTDTDEVGLEYQVKLPDPVAFRVVELPEQIVRLTVGVTFEGNCGVKQYLATKALVGRGAVVSATT